MYSAIQIDGQRLYDLARQGIKKEVPQRAITISEIELLNFYEDTNEWEIKITASKGTYVRTICHDIGKALGSCAAMTHLVRVRAGHFDISESYTLDQLQQLADEGRVSDIVIDTDSIFTHYPRVNIDEAGAKRASHGAFIFPRNTKGVHLEEGAILRVYYNDRFIMLGQVKALDIGGIGLFTYKNFDIESIKEGK